MTTLALLAEAFSLSCTRLRRVARDSCGIPEGAEQYLIDGWLYERIATAIVVAGPHFTLSEDRHVLRMIGLTLPVEGDDVVKACQVSYAEYAANPVARHEILIPGRPVHFVPTGFFEDNAYWSSETIQEFAIPLVSQEK